MQREGKYHVTLYVEVYGVMGNNQKRAQFWLCDDCERNNRALLARDNNQRARVARAVCPPRYLAAQGD